MNPPVKVTRDGEVAIIKIDNPPVNALSPAVCNEIATAVKQIAEDNDVKAAVFIGAGRTFVAGADINEFVKATSGKSPQHVLMLPSVLLDIENCPKPVVMAVHGAALGGGLELALAGHYRVSSPGAQLGQPEVKLGIIPGAGGTQRLPRLAGIAKALDMCVNGDPIRAEEALKVGIVDELVSGDLLTGAVAFARTVAGKPVPKVRERNEKLGSPEEAAPLFAAARGLAQKKYRGMKAPQAAINSVRNIFTHNFDEACELERKLFAECLYSDQSKALIHLFFAEREAAKIPDVPKETPVASLASAAVVGAGTMGAGIAMVFANAGIPVLLKEVDPQALQRGMTTIRRNYANSVKSGRFTQQFVDERLALIKPTFDYQDFAAVDMVVEAVFEGMALKKQVFGELDRVCKAGAILASNTSTLNIDEIASSTSRPDAVIGTHFFSPANVMRLLEIVRGKHSSAKVIATCMQLSKRLGKVGVLVGNCRGFVGNRMFEPYLREADFLVEEGAAVEAVDNALYEFGMAMGPLATSDLAGLDVGWRIRQEYRHLQKPDIRQPLATDRLCEMGRFGQKAGAGWYQYDEARCASSDPLVAVLVRNWAEEAGIAQREIAAEEIVERCIYALVNEGARLLEEGYALRAGDIDVVYVNGYGFPRYRGGPMWYADTVGLEQVYARVREFHEQHGALWEPAPLLKKLAEQGKTFAEYATEQRAVA